MPAFLGECSCVTTAALGWSTDIELLLVRAMAQDHINLHFMCFHDTDPQHRYTAVDESAGEGSGEDPVCWTIMETVAGRILHTHCQHSVQEPISAVFYDHTSLMMFTDKRSLRTVAVALEVYDRSRPQFQVFRDLGMPFYPSLSFLCLICTSSLLLESHKTFAKDVY